MNQEAKITPAAVALREEIARLEMPEQIRRLPVDARGYPVPWFVARVRGVPDHRVVDPRKAVKAHEERRCFICGDRLGPVVTFTFGPIAAINRISGEPPSHFACAEFAAKACPFLTRPEARRREAHMPEVVVSEIALAHNPGVTLLWTTTHFHLIPGPVGEMLWYVGLPDHLRWMSGGREALPTDVYAAVSTAVVRAREIARADFAGAVEAMEKNIAGAAQYFPEWVRGALA